MNSVIEHQANAHFINIQEDYLTLSTPFGPRVSNELRTSGYSVVRGRTSGKHRGKRQKPIHAVFSRLLPMFFPSFYRVLPVFLPCSFATLTQRQRLNTTSDAMQVLGRRHAEGDWYDWVTRKRNLRSRGIVSLREAWTPCVSSATWGREKTVHAEEEKGL